MFFMSWGEAEVEVAVEQCRCRECGYARPSRVGARYKYFRVWFVFGAVEKARYWTTCEGCGYTERVSARAAAEAAGYSPIPLRDRRGLAALGVAVVALVAALFVRGVVLRAGAVPADVPAESTEADPNLAPLVGTWEVVSREVDGEEKVAGRGGPRRVITFRGDGRFEWEGAFGTPGRVSRIDPSKDPKEIDYTFAGGGVQRAIYRIDGDTLVDCCAPTGARDRPAEFRSTRQNGYSLLVYKRVKRED